jgi:hypothetical protein
MKTTPSRRRAAFATLSLFAVMSSACVVDLSDDVDTKARYDEPIATEADGPACETALPDPGAFDAPLLLGITSDEPAGLTKLTAWVEVAPDAQSFAVTVQARDADTGDLIGPAQDLGEVAIAPDGTFAFEELAVTLPMAAMPTGDHGQAAVANVRGGFCEATESIQGSYDGWTLTPTATPTTGSWFIAHETD